MDRFKEPKEPRVIYHCAECHGDIHEGDEALEVIIDSVSNVIHELCKDDYFENFIFSRGVVASDGGID